MSYTVAEAQAEVEKRSRSKAAPGFSLEEAQAEVQRRKARGAELAGIPAEAKRMVGRGLLEAPMVAGEALEKGILSIPGVKQAAAAGVRLMPHQIRQIAAALGGKAVSGGEQFRPVTAEDIRPATVVEHPTAVGKVGGMGLAGYLAGELAGAAPGAAMGAIPGVGEAAAAYPKVSRVGRALGYGVGGAAISPEHRGRGFLTGTALGGALEAPAEAMMAATAIPEAISRGTGRLATKLSPNRYAKEIVKRIPKFRSAEERLNELSGGAELPENTKNAATALREKYGLLQKQNEAHFSPVEEGAGKGSIYKNVLPFSPFGTSRGYLTHEGKLIANLTPRQAKRELLASLPEDSYVRHISSPLSPVKNYPTLLKQTHREFMAKPNYKNAHKLQSALYDRAEDLGKAHVSEIEKRDLSERIFDARAGVLKDIKRHLDTVDPTENLKNRYDFARDFHREEVVPYKNKRLVDISKGRIKNPRDLTTTFKNPEEDISKVVSDLGSNFSNKILYHDLRKAVGKNPTAEKLTDAYAELEKRGLAEYKTSKLEEQMNSLRQKSAIDKLVKGAGKKPTAENLLKSHGKLGKKLEEQLPGSLQDQLMRLEKRVGRRSLIRKGALWGAGVTGAGSLGYGGWKLGHLL